MNQFSDLTKFYLMSHPCISSSSSSFWTTYQQTLIKVKCYFHTVKGDFNGYVFPSQDSDASRHVWKSAKWLNFSRGRKSLSGTPSSYLYVAKGGARWDTKGPYLIWRDIFILLYLHAFTRYLLEFHATIGTLWKCRKLYISLLKLVISPKRSTKRLSTRLCN